MNLTQKQIKFLKSLGHSIAPVVTVADRGLVETVIAAVDEALDVHELIKVKVRLPREERTKIYQDLCRKTGAIEVQTIGMMLLIYRPTKNSIIDLPGPKLTQQNNGSK